MDIATIVIVLFIAFLFYCEKYTIPSKKKKIEHFHSSGIKNFYNFKTVDSPDGTHRPPMQSPYQCTLNFNCSHDKPSDKYGNVCKKCTAKTFPSNIVMARVVGSTKQQMKLY
tara:strand:+ start:12221 stop:12556 length:336 start_codon:yes stop_codon:yes gene_type:complete